jgi:hypothetical protein
LDNVRKGVRSEVGALTLDLGETGKRLDYQLGRPHLEKGKNRFSIEEVPSSDKEGV